MADITVDIPGVGSVDFPDTMKPEEITAAAKRLHDAAHPPESFGRQAARTALDTLPGIGGIVGGVLSTPETLGVGTIPGMALGVGAGRGARDLIGHYTGLDQPTTPGEKAGNIAKDAAIAAVVPGAIEAVKTPLRTVGEAFSTFGNSFNSRSIPQTIYKMGKAVPEMWRGAQPADTGMGTLTRPPWQGWEQAPTAAAEAPTGGMLRTPGTSAAAQGLSDAERASLTKQGYPPELIARIEQRAGQTSPGTPAPMPSHAPTAAPTGPPLQPELQGPRIVTGAERVGRQVGMTKEDVRTAAGPVLDEARGDASPILPKEALGSIVDTLKALPPGAEREAYVARATSGKTKWQVENIRRTLEHLGLLIPAATFAPGVRDELMRLMTSHNAETP